MRKVLKKSEIKQLCLSLPYIFSLSIQNATFGIDHHRRYPLLASWKRFRVLRVRTALGGPEPLVIWWRVGAAAGSRYICLGGGRDGPTVAAALSLPLPPGLIRWLPGPPSPWAGPLPHTFGSDAPGSGPFLSASSRPLSLTPLAVAPFGVGHCTSLRRSLPDTTSGLKSGTLRVPRTWKGVASSPSFVWAYA